MNATVNEYEYESMHSAPELNGVLPPHSIEAEQAVLGALILSEGEKLLDIEGHLSAVDFYRENHRQLFDAILGLSESGQKIDIITLAEHLNEKGELERVGGLEYLSALNNDVPSTANVTAYADIVRERSVLRSLGKVGRDIADSAQSSDGRPSKELLDEAEAKIYAIAEQGETESTAVEMNVSLKAMVQRVDDRFRNPGKLIGQSTGLSELDTMIGGWQDDHLIVVAARPSMGKSAFATSALRQVVVNDNNPAIMFSMEMPHEDQMTRLVANIGQIEVSRLLSGDLKEDDWPKMSAAAAMLKDKPLIIDDRGSVSVGYIRAQCRRAMKLLSQQRDKSDSEGEPKRLRLVVVDHLHIMNSGPGTNPAGELGAVTKALKGLARELKCPVMLLAQLNRGVEQRPNKRPMNSDLRDSGRIEEDADEILFLYRDEYYDDNSPDKGIAEVLVGKSRNGPTGTVKTSFIGKYTKFSDLVPEAWYDN